MSSSMSNILLDKEILLESGTNELELLVFDVADYTFGINVAKVREVLPTARITCLPRAHSSVRGVFKLRNRVIPCVSLTDHLGITPTRETSEGTMILTDFNQQQTAFLVDEVERIHRLSWENILAVPGLEALSSTPVTALARCEDRLIVMLDFEMILDDVTDQLFRTDPVENPLGLPREELKIVLADDSPTVREAIGNTLRASGYTQLLFFENGGTAWQWFDEQVKTLQPGERVCDLVISDVEMPQVDGFHLTKRIKEHPHLGRIPVLLYSSIITPDNFKKGQAVRADDQISKPELDQVVGKADALISAAQREGRAIGLQEVAEMTEADPRPNDDVPTSPDAALTPPDAAANAADASPVQNKSATDASPVEDGGATGVSPVPASPQPGPRPASEATQATVREPQNARPSPLDPRSSNGLISDDVPAPTGVSAKLWTTFRNELLDRNEQLAEVLRQTASGARDEDVVRQLGRVLHTIKSAAMVIPLDAVTRATHQAESCVQAVDGGAAWPQEALERYLGWLRLVADPPVTVDDVLGDWVEIEAELSLNAVAGAK